MSNPPVFVTSDVHLGAIPEARVQAFHRWLEHVADRSRHLVINGDLFDFWFEYESVIPRGYTRTLGILSQMVDAGIRVDLLGGNHDWWGGSFLEDEVGLHFHPGPVELELAGHRALVAHGDGLGPGDRGYRILSSIIRHPLVRWGFRWIHPDVGGAVARKISRTELRVEGSEEAPPATRARAPALEKWARDQLLADDSLDLVLLGHIHLPVRTEMAPGRFYINSGDWLRHQSYVELNEGSAPRLLEWEASAPRT